LINLQITKAENNRQKEGNGNGGINTKKLQRTKLCKEEKQVHFE